jgi:hypothetical protein
MRGIAWQNAPEQRRLSIHAPAHHGEAAYIMAQAAYIMAQAARIMAQAAPIQPRQRRRECSPSMSKPLSSK